MGLAFERKNLLSCRSERVKAVDFHPTEPWVLSALYNGTVTIRNFQTNSLVKTIEVCDLPVRTAKFIARKNWIVCGSDDLMIRVFNYNTLERVTQFSAHSDYIRSLAVHPTRPFLLSSSDDLTIKLWDWERAWKQVATFEGHTHYVMALAFNPKDSNVFASVSLDKTIKMWSFNTISAGVSSNTTTAPPVCVKANYTLSDGHEKGINCLDFYVGADRPFLVTGSDDFTVRVWDYHTKSCVRVLEGHSNNISAVAFHPQLPLLMSASEDGGMRIWNALTFRPEASYSFGMERAWGLATSRSFNAVAIGFDAGTLVMQLGRGDPAASLDLVQGRLVWSRSRNGVLGNEILTALVRLVDVDGKPVRSPADGELIPLSPKELGTSDVFPQSLAHSPDGRMVAVCGDGEFVLYSTIGWRNRGFGRGQEVVWGDLSSVYAVRESASRIVINKLLNGTHDSEPIVLNVSGADRIFGNGPLLGISLGGSTLCFYDWSGSCLIRVIDVAATAVNWSPCGRFVAILTDDGCFVLSVNREILAAPQSYPSGEDGIEDSMDLVDELDVSLKSISWVKGSDCFVYLTTENKLAYHVVGGGADEAFQIALFDRPTFMLGYLAAEERVYVCDQDLQVSSFSVCGPLIAFQSAVLQCTQSSLPAETTGLLSSIPVALHAKLASFLNRRGFVREALKLSPDADFKFSLALQLGELKVAQSILIGSNNNVTSAWSELGRAALRAWNLPIAEEAFIRASDLPSLFLLYAAGGDAAGLRRIAKEAAAAGQVNLAFSALFKAGELKTAFDLLMKEGRPAEAAIFARTYGLPVETISAAVKEWRSTLNARRGKSRLAEAIADPVQNADMFELLKGRNRSVSFDGNVSVVGGGQVQLKPEELSFTTSSSTSGSVTATQPISPGSPSTTTSQCVDAIAGSLASSQTTDHASIFSDDQMSLEVNTAGTGAMRLEDLEECDLPEGREEDISEAADLDNLKGPCESSSLLGREEFVYEGATVSHDERFDVQLSEECLTSEVGGLSLEQEQANEDVNDEAEQFQQQQSEAVYDEQLDEDVHDEPEQSASEFALEEEIKDEPIQQQQQQQQQQQLDEIHESYEPEPFEPVQAEYTSHDFVYEADDDPVDTESYKNVHESNGQQIEEHLEESSEQFAYAGESHEQFAQESLGVSVHEDAYGNAGNADDAIQSPQFYDETERVDSGAADVQSEVNEAEDATCQEPQSNSYPEAEQFDDFTCEEAQEEEDPYSYDANDDSFAYAHEQIVYEQAASAEADQFSYEAAPSSAAAASQNTNANEEAKAQQSPASVYEDIDFGGDDDVDGWL